MITSKYIFKFLDTGVSEKLNKKIKKNKSLYQLDSLEEIMSLKLYIHYKKTFSIS